MTAKTVKRNKEDGRFASKYSDAYAQEIFEALATTSHGLKRICREKRAVNPDFPTYLTTLNWIRAHEEFAELWRTAKLLQCDLIFDEIIEIADGIDESIEGSEKKAKVQIQARQYTCERVAPKKYGNTQQIELGELMDRLQKTEGMLLNKRA